MSDIAQDERVLTIERLIAAPPEKLFELWTDPAKLVQWWGPDGADVPDYSLDVRPGGKWRTVMRLASGGQHTVSGVYRVIDPPRRLVFTWAWEDDKGLRGHETEVSVTFHPAPGGTRLALTQRAFETVEARNLHGVGWNSSFDCLARAI